MLRMPGCAQPHRGRDPLDQCLASQPGSSPVRSGRSRQRCPLTDRLSAPLNEDVPGKREGLGSQDAWSLYRANCPAGSCWEAIPGYAVAEFNVSVRRKHFSGCRPVTARKLSFERGLVSRWRGKGLRPKAATAIQLCGVLEFVGRRWFYERLAVIPTKSSRC